MTRRDRGPALLVAGAFFMENLDATIISTAAPDMAASPMASGLVPKDAATAVTFLLCGLLGARTPLALVVAVLFVSGVCRSVSLSAYATIAFADIEPERTADANALASTVQQLATGLGIALAALGLRASGPLAALLGLDGPTAAYAVAFGLLAVLPLACVAEALQLPRDAGAVVTGPASELVERPAARSAG
ncbi:MFS transporter [Streptomyces resistomycificus]|uniref:hypothetical protein n=1 Tax=Streptomyces resistomycificus TaxID=67356 RepID=UPI0004AA322B|nr:hypothetical protein [Streptomyces resistomycificus]